jgi:uncharacterized membrane protein (DUF4010 family)
MYALGAYLAVGDATAAIVVGGVVAVLLHWKQPLHRFVEQIGERDIHAMMQLLRSRGSLWNWLSWRLAF